LQNDVNFKKIIRSLANINTTFHTFEKIGLNEGARLTKAGGVSENAFAGRLLNKRGMDKFRLMS
jgi:hypothetical protein